MKAACYVRVSSEMQIDNFSISAQVNELNKYCLKEGIEVFKVYADEGISGTIEARPQFQLMLSDAEKKLFDVILVHKYDRFARNVELSQKVKRQLKKANVGLISITEPLEDSPMGFFVGGLHDLMAEYYSRNLGKESKKGHTERASQGFHNGSVPYGYKRVIGTNDIEINDEQAIIVRSIFDMYVNKGMGSSKISRLLNDTNVLTAVNGEWGHYTVNYILKNEKYIGKIIYDGKVYQGNHEPIITDDIFEKAQRFLKDRCWNRQYRGSNFNKFLLLGMLYCGYCGKTMKVWIDKRRGKSCYKCNDSAHYDKLSRCTHGKNHNTIDIHNEVLSYIESITKGVISDLGNENEPIIDLYSERKGSILKELQRAKAAYLKEYFTLEEYGETKTKLEKELKEIPEITESKKSIVKISNAWDEYLVCDEISKQKTSLKKIIKKVEVYDKKIAVHLV